MEVTVIRIFSIAPAGNERNYGGRKSSFIEGPAECFSADAIKSSGLDIN